MDDSVFLLVANSLFEESLLATDTRGEHLLKVKTRTNKEATRTKRIFIGVIMQQK